MTSVLQHIAQPPKELFVAGKLTDSHEQRPPIVAIVGSRNPSGYGKEVTHRFAYDLARAGVVIVSGLALGIDAIAHSAALKAEGVTIAVLAGGLHAIYPPRNTNLAREIVQAGGALITEKEMGYEARPYDFLARNRLVSGLADAIIVTEATEKSGTLSTVNHALDQNKEVFAVPGPITSLTSAGANRLLQQGAHVALCADDVLRVIAPDLLTEKQQNHQSRLPLGDSPEEVAILTALHEGVKESEQLQKASGLATTILLQTLTILELKGSIHARGGGKWSL